MPSRDWTRAFGGRWEGGNQNMKVMALKVIKYAHTQTHMQRTSMSLCKCDSVWMCMRVCVLMSMGVCACVCTCVCVCVCGCGCVRACVCIGLLSVSMPDLAANPQKWTGRGQDHEQTATTEEPSFN